jgi:Skp family chaperone for outer membrane proteins
MSRIALAALMLAAATPALAQTVSTAPPIAAEAAPDLGPAIPGLCLFSREQALASAKVGVAASQRLKQFLDQAQAVAQAEIQPLEAEAKTLQSPSSKLSQGEFLQRAQQLQAAREAAQQRAALRSRQIEITRDQQRSLILTQAQPLLNQAYKAHHCGLLLDLSVVYGGNMSGDLTPDLVKAMDTYLTPQSFDLAPLPAAATSPPAATPPPAAQPATSSKKKK